LTAFGVSALATLQYLRPFVVASALRETLTFDQGAALRNAVLQKYCEATAAIIIGSSMVYGGYHYIFPTSEEDTRLPVQN